MNDSDPTSFEPMRPDPTSLSKFVRLTKLWRLDDDEVGCLLQVDTDAWLKLRDGDGLLDFEARIRLGHCLDIAEAVAVLAPKADQGDWLRQPHPILDGRSPMYFMLKFDDALRSIRWTMLTETRPGFPHS